MKHPISVSLKPARDADVHLERCHCNPPNRTHVSDLEGIRDCNTSIESLRRLVGNMVRNVPHLLQKLIVISTKQKVPLRKLARGQRGAIGSEVVHNAFPRCKALGGRLKSMTEPAKRTPWLSIDMLVIVVSLAIILTGIWIAF
jgi:hypothetical protein